MELPTVLLEISVICLWSGISGGIIGGIICFLLHDHK